MTCSLISSYFFSASFLDFSSNTFSSSHLAFSSFCKTQHVYVVNCNVKILNLLNFYLLDEKLQITNDASRQKNSEQMQNEYKEKGKANVKYQIDKVETKLKCISKPHISHRYTLIQDTPSLYHSSLNNILLLPQKINK